MNRSLRSGEFYGQTQMRHRFSGFRLMEAVYPSSISLPKHSHQCACFSIMLDGAMTEHYRSRTLESHRQTVGFNAAEEPHSNRILGRGARFLILEIGSEQTKQAQQYSPRFNSSAVFRGGDLSWLGLKLFRESLQYDPVSPLAIEGLALEMIATLCRIHSGSGGTRSPRWLAQARELIHDQFAEALSVASIAETVGVHSVHLSRTFRQRYGKSIGDYVRTLRIERARHDLASTSRSLIEIAANSGFYDQGHLSRVFKRFVGMTPGQYRRLFQNSHRDD